MNEVFPLNVPGRIGHGLIRDELASRLRTLDVVVAGFDDADLAGGGLEATVDLLLAAHSVDEFTCDDPVVDPVPQSTYTYSCDAPLCFEARRPGGTRQHTHRTPMMHATVALTTGEMELLRFAPSTSYTPLDPNFVFWRGRAIVLRFPPDDSELARTNFASLTEALTSTNVDIALHNQRLDASIRSRLDARASVVRAQRAGAQSTGWAVRSPRAEPVAYRIPDTRRSTAAPRPRPPVEEIEFQLDRRDFVDVLQCIAVWADSAERQPGVAAGAGEDELRNALLAALRTRFVDGTGEAFSVRGKTDLRILVRTSDGEIGPQVFHAECKIWSGPAIVDEAVEQLVERYSTRRDRLGALVFFVVDRVNPDRVQPAAVDRLVERHGGVEISPIAGWRVVRIPDPAQPARAIDLAVVSVAVLDHRRT